MVNVRAIANRATRGVNPNIAAVARVSAGYTTGASGKQQPAYAPAQPVTLQVQAVSKRELEHLANLNISKVDRAAYANVQLSGVDRIDQSGGDLVLFEGFEWLVVAVLEGWTTAGWCKVALVKQRPSGGTPIALAGKAVASSSVSGVTRTTVSLGGASLAFSAGSLVQTAGVGLAGVSSSVSFASAATTRSSPLSASSIAASQAAAVLNLGSGLTGLAAATSSLSALMTTGAVLNGSVSASSNGTGVLSTRAALLASAAATSSTSGDMTVAGQSPLSSSSAAMSAGSATLAAAAVLSGASTATSATSGTVTTRAALVGSSTATSTGSGAMTGGGSTTRAYTLADAPTPPSVWGDMQAASTITYDATSKRISSVTNKGTAGGSFAPPATANAPLYNATGFNGAYPAATFNSAEPDYLLTSAASPAQPATVVYVWQQGTSMKAYEVFADHDTNVSGSRQTVFSAYGGTTPIYIVRTVSGSETQVNIGGGNEAANRVNVMVVEYNGTSSRIYLNGVLLGTFNLGTVLTNVGLAIGGKKGDAATYFGGNMGEVAIIPAVFGPGDAWDRVTQGTMWKWGQQANIAAGATYKNAAPTVTS